MKTKIFLITVALLNFALINALFAQQLTADAGHDTTICIGQSIQIGGAPTGSGGTAPYTYSWSPTTGLSSSNIPNPSALPYTTTTYTVTVTDSLGSTASDFVIISVQPFPYADAGSDITLCAGDTVMISATGGIQYTWSPSSTLSNSNIPNPLAYPSTTTTYTVTISTGYGCTASDNVIVTITPIADFILFPDTAVQHHYFVTNSASGVSPLTYLWSWGDGSYDSIAYPTHTYSAAGYYTICLTVTDALGCVNTHCDSSYLQKSPKTIISVDVIPDVITYINLIELAGQIKIYPNPVNDNLIIEAPHKAVIEILDINGKIIKTISSNSKTSTADLTDLSSGVYIIKAKTDKEIVTKKFIKQ